MLRKNWKPKKERYSSIPKDSAYEASKMFKNNLKIEFAILCVFAVGIIFQILRWQIFDQEKFVSLAQAQYLRSKPIDTTRGTIYAADGTILAIDEPAWKVYASLSSIPEEREEFFKEKDSYIEKVSGILGIDPNDLKSKLTDNFRYFLIKSGISDEKKKALEEVKIFSKKPSGFGLYFEQENKRSYPDGKLASHVLGFIGKTPDGTDLGMYGIEGYFFSDITGQQGQTYEEKDSKGNIILTSEYEPIYARHGKNITLTIIPSLQKKVEDALQEGVEKHQAKSGTVIIMNPKTGEIYAMANYPDYNPNEYWRVTDASTLKNKAVSDVYEYGSVQKPITVAIGLESGKITKNFTCNDQTGFIELYDKKIYTASNKPDGLLSLSGILEKSNNPCIVRVALQTGFQEYYPKLKEFGLGSYIGMGLQDESTSYLMPYENWTKIDLAVTAFGQSISATPLQILSALSTIANDGKRMQPYIVSEVSDEKETIKHKQLVLSQPISKETADTVTDMMRNVVRKGEAKGWFNKEVPDYDIAGKTGTAQIPMKNEAGYYKDRTNTTFVGFAPADDPKMIMIVKLEEPGLNTFSASTVVPLWIDIFKKTADDLEIPKNK